MSNADKPSSSRRPPAMHRRRFLQAAGLGAGSLFLPSMLRSRGIAAAAPDGPPMRLFIVYTNHGCPQPNWRIRPSGLPADRAWEIALAERSEAELSRCLQPLHRHRAKMLVVDGLAQAVALADPYGDSHAKGWCASLTGETARETHSVNKSHGSKPSLDQVIATELRKKEPWLTDLASLEYGVGEGNYHYALYRPDPNGGPVLPMAHENSPAQAYQRLFPKGDGQAPRDPVLASQPDLMSDLAGLYEQTAARLSTEDRQKLSAHRDLLRDTERRLRYLSTLECRAPSLTAPDGSTTMDVRQAMTRSFFDLATAALSCRVSRVVTLQLGELPVEAIGGTGDLHHKYAHRSGEYLVGAADYPEALEGMTAYNLIHARQVADLCDRLDAIPEGDGTLLDHTMVVWTGELGDGAHNHLGWPVVMIGGGARFRTGRYLHVAQQTPTTSVSPWDRDDQLIGQPHNHFLVSLAQAMGVDTDVVGAASLKARKAGVPDVSLRGPLAGLV